MTLLSEDLREIVRSVRVVSATACVLDGRPLDLSLPEAAGDDGGEPRERLVASLRLALYQRLYSRGSPPAARVNALERRDHVASLSRANCGRGTWDPDWRLRGRDAAGRFEVRRDGVSYWTDAVRAVSGGDAVAGDGYRVRLPRELRELHLGFYTALGDADRLPRASQAHVLRLYWHLQAEAAVPWVRALTRGFNRRAIPFRLKAVDSPRDHCRADAGVLYLEPRHYPAARRLVRGVYRDLRAALGETVPMFTLRLAPGLGLAEGPSGGGSFGGHRCRLIAGALVAAFEDRVEGEDECAERVARAFRAAGLDPLRPYRAAGSKKVYRPLPASDLAVVTSAERGRSQPAPAPSLLAGARRIGDRLCRDAFLHRGRCSWIGRSAEEERQDGPLTPIAAALGPNLYAGTAGVGLFLARLHAATGDPEHRRTALGALRQALAQVREPRFRSDPLSLFSGRLGVVWAARQAAELTGAAELAKEARTMFLELTAKLDGKHLLDLIGGAAGAIPVLLELHRATGEPRVLAAAVALGEEICDAAIRDGETWRWDNERAGGICADRPPLTGFSHGAAGMSAALAVLHAATGGPRFLAGARGAIAFEDGLFDEQRGNWPDFTGKRRTDTPRYVAWWAHGAPGIALARLQAMARVPELEPVCAPAARAALATTRRALEDGLRRSDADSSLCLGLAGLIEVLAVAGRLLGEAELRSVAEGAMKVLLEVHGARGSWPSGVPSRGRNPSLMLGAAGVGYTMLRLRDPHGVPPILLPGAWLDGVASR